MVGWWQYHWHIQSDREQLTTCPGSVTLHEFADQVLDFARVEPEQVIIVHVSTPEDASIDKTFEDTWDQVCKVHAERTEGTDAFVKREVIQWYPSGTIIQLFFL